MKSVFSSEDVHSWTKIGNRLKTLDCLQLEALLVVVLGYFLLS